MTKQVVKYEVNTQRPGFKKILEAALDTNGNVTITIREEAPESIVSVREGQIAMPRSEFGKWLRLCGQL